MGSAGVKLNGGSAYLKRRRLRMFYAQKGLCYYCTIPMTLNKRPNPPFPNYATFEHLIPQALGGSGRVENLVLACYDCNQWRGEELSAQMKLERIAASGHNQC